MKYKQIRRLSGLQRKSTIVLAGSVFLLVGCLAGFPIPTDKASDHFEVEYIETHQGSTRQEVVQKLGVPDAIFRSDGKTYYLYDATGDQRLIVGAVFVVPPFYVPFWAPKSEDAVLHCLALIFDERGLLQDYRAKTAPSGVAVAVLLPPEFPAGALGEKATNCAGVLWDDEELAQLDIVPQYTHPQFTPGRALGFGEVNGIPLIIATDSIHTVHLWDVRVDRFLDRILSGHQALVTSLVVGQLNDKPILVTGSADRTVRLWDLQNGTLLGEPWKGHEGRIVSVALIEVDGLPTVFSAAEDGTVRMWNARVGTLLHEYVMEAQPVFIGDGDGKPVVVASSFDQSIHLWDLFAGKMIGEALPGHEGLGTAVALALIDGRAVLASAGGDNTIQILDARTGKPMREPLHGHKRPITNIAVGEIEGMALVASVDESKAILVWDLTGSGEPLTEQMVVTDPQIAGITLFDLEGLAVIATSSTNHNVRLWDALKGHPIGEVMWFDIDMRRAEQGDPESQFQVYRHLVTTDERQARAWLCRSADTGYFEAQLELGQWYWRGPKGVPRDIRRAYMWYSLAAREGGSAWDVWELRAVAHQMTREQQAEANQLLKDHQPGQCERDLVLDFRHQPRNRTL